MQPNGCRSCRRAEEKATGVCGHDRDQEVELMGQRGWFLANFGPDFLLLQAINSASIYRWLKRVILSLQEKNFQPLIKLGRIPTVGSK